ncbi:DUF87 domain-containing protein [Bradyrhizobium sp. 41S5]|uniref:helicase HerA domain-containing protein n=1 Tax=Bradyrhizobium sp. 41S5 TaxID=1404443 RepID=UPI00156AC102|nr:DUF87 domain-containing protein [Bradyrhizobium sp. 41S5]UFX42163.1 DUF87 domain-containing protein [Bradyrhizobium sp. 41S5]
MTANRITAPVHATIGTYADGADAQLDLDKLVGSHLCIQGNSGAGKSGAIRKLLEATHGFVQHIILDVEDEFYTLREKFEYLIAGGDNGDCEASVHNAAALALMILKTGFSAIIQINSLPIDGRREFIAQFLDALIAAPKDLWHPALVVLDEAQMYAPQVGIVGSSAAVTSLMTLGRKRGFTGVLATPRISSINKDATGPVNNWLMGRIGQPTDRRSTADALGFRANSEEARGLLKLRTRQFWAFGPALCLEPTQMMIGDAATTVIKAGQAAVPTPPAPAAMQRMLAQLNAAAKATKTVDPDTADAPVLRAEITRLKSELAAKGTQPPATGAAQEEIDAAYQEGLWDGLNPFLDLFEDFKVIGAGVQNLLTRVGEVQAKHKSAVEHAPPHARELRNHRSLLKPGSPPKAPPRAPVRPAAPPPSPAASGDGPIGGVQQKILNSVAEMQRLCRLAPPRQLVALVAGYKNVKSTGFAKALSGLSADGLVSYPDTGTVALTEKGLSAARPRPAAMTTEEVQAQVIAILGETAGKILGHLITVYPGVMERAALAEWSGYQNVKSTGFAKALSRLSSLGFVSYPSTGTAKAGEILFP